ncbi:Cuticlin-1 like protein [Argiope bruennichi]|uniref:Cuticlin-1 like protein n=1 Tax=Argiope bruennichi TaxID=94029 RepID=A0A8T0ELZ9_ARGBR|nr:Cuticlin-1 like protein [Argiope bruennichi]
MGSQKSLVSQTGSLFTAFRCVILCPADDSHCDHEWAFDEVQGVQLFHYLDKTVKGVNSSDSCMLLCLAESTFVCRSARYDSSKSECILSRHDRRTASEVFRQSPDPDSVLYLERQCVEEPQGCQFRSRQSRAIMRRHRHVQVIGNITSREACELACLESVPFPCRSYQFGGQSPTCLLSPEDSNSELGTLEPTMKTPNDVIDDEDDGTYFEKESCIDVDIQCGPTAMDVIVRVSTPFRGRVYAAGHPYECYSVSVSESGRVTLSMPLHGRHCGTRNLGNGTFVNSVVVQHHAFVLRTSDRRIDVACDYEEMKLKVRGAKSVKHGEMKPLAHTVTAVAPTPPIRLRVVNATDQDVTGVELGDPLFLKVELADESVYGIFGSDLVAKGSSGTETVLLIDENGCPVEPSVVQALDRLPGSKSLMAPFQAFKFASDAAVQFQMTVSYCLDNCPPAECDVPRSTHTKSFGKKKRRRRSTSQFTDLLPGDVISDVTMESPMFLVTNLKPTLDTEQPSRWEHQLHSKDHSEGHIHVKAHSQGLCISLTTLYIIGAIIGAVQVIIVCVCASLFFCRTEHDIRTKTGTSTKSWPSVSSRRKLVCSHS